MKKQPEKFSGCLGGQPFAQALHGAPLQTRHLHLRDMQDAGGALLRQAVIKPQGDDLPLRSGSWRSASRRAAYSTMRSS